MTSNETFEPDTGIGSKSVCATGDAWEELIGVNRFRETLYSILARLFGREIESGFWPKIRESIDLIDRAGDISDWPGNDDMVVARRELREYFRAVERQELPEVLTELRRQYAALFLGVGRETVPLCESVYTGATATLCQGAYFDVRRSLRETGWAKADDFSEPEDHVAMELAQMACLSRMMDIELSAGASTWREVLVTQRRFMAEHLLNWVPELTERINAVAPGSLYASASRLLAGFLRLDQELLDFMDADESP